MVLALLDSFLTVTYCLLALHSGHIAKEPRVGIPTCTESIRFWAQFFNSFLYKIFILFYSNITQNKILSVQNTVSSKIINVANSCKMQCCGSGMFIPDPGSGSNPCLSSRILDTDQGSRILHQEVSCKICSPFLMITVGNVHTKVDFSSFSIFLKGLNFIIYQFYYLKFNFSHVWDPRSEIRDPRSGIRDPGSGKIIPDPWGKKRQISDPYPQHWQNVFC
jgi:hypothetical protein